VAACLAQRLLAARKKSRLRALAPAQPDRLHPTLGAHSSFGPPCHSSFARPARPPQGFLIQALFTSHAGAFAVHVLLVYSALYWFLAAVTYGAFIPSGLFTPSLIFGGCLGRIYADLLVGQGAA
jgi:hypothetical protein